jgi:hypothetical protein
MDMKRRKSSILIAGIGFYSILANMIYWLSLLLEAIGDRVAKRLVNLVCKIGLVLIERTSLIAIRGVLNGA